MSDILENGNGEVLEQTEGAAAAPETEPQGNVNPDTMSQEDIDYIVQKRTGRYAAKNSRLKSENERLKAELQAAQSDASRYRMLDKALKDEGYANDSDRFGAIAAACGMDEKAFIDRMSEVGKNTEPTKADMYMEVHEFMDSADDDDIVEAFEDLAKKRKSDPDSFTKSDNFRFHEMEKRYLDIRYNRDVAEADAYCKGKGVDLSDILSDENYKTFSSGLHIPITESIKKYLSMNKPAPVKSTGSVKDVGGNVAKDFYSREEVEKMSPEEIRKNMDIIHKSMPGWK